MKVRKVRTSVLWHYFKIKDQEKKIAKCNRCGQCLNYRATVTNLKKHLERRHPDITVPSYKNIKSEANDDGDINMVVPIDDSPSPSSSFALVPGESQCSVSPNRQSENNSENELGLPSNNSMGSFLPPSYELSESEKLDKLLLQLFVQHYHPFSIVEDEAFINFVNGLNLWYKLPSKETVTNTMIPAEYDKCLHAARHELQAVKNVCLSIDIWKSENLNNSYMDVTAHYITETFELRSILLECLLLPVSPTSSDLAELIQGVARKFKLGDKLSIVVSDSASNINDEVTKDLKVEHLNCFAHTLNLIIQDALTTAKDLIDKIKNIVNYFTRNSSSSQKLNLAQKATFDLEPKKLIQEDSTRWNSTFYMIQRFSELQDAIKTTIESISEDLPVLTEDEWTACKELSTVLEPFEEVTEEICEEQYITGSLVIPLTNGLRSVCDMMQEEEFGSTTKCVIDEILKGINLKLRNIEDNKSLALATFLDPRFKLAPFSDEFSAQSIKKHCTSLIADIWSQEQKSKANTDQSNNDCNQSDASNNSSVGRLVKFSVWDKLDKTIASKKSTGSMSAALIEVNRYLEDTFLGRKEDPLLWWKKNQYYYPLMSKLVITKFNVVGTSLPCERLFTKAGNVMAERRSRLKTKNLEKLLFLNANSFLIS